MPLDSRFPFPNDEQIPKLPRFHNCPFAFNKNLCSPVWNIQLRTSYSLSVPHISCTLEGLSGWGPPYSSSLESGNRWPVPGYGMPPLLPLPGLTPLSLRLGVTAGEVGPVVVAPAWWMLLLLWLTLAVWLTPSAPSGTRWWSPQKAWLDLSTAQFPHTVRVQTLVQPERRPMETETNCSHVPSAGAVECEAHRLVWETEVHSSFTAYLTALSLSFPI